ncbi:transcription factor A, mitochondrial [Pogona vitticeps]
MAAALLARVFSSLPRPRYILSAACPVDKWFSKYVSSDNRPKKPLSAYLRFFVDQQPIYRKQNPGLGILDITRKIAFDWKELPSSAKQTYETAAEAEMQLYKEQLAKYKAQLTPAQEKALKEEKMQKMEKRRANIKKRKLAMLGKPKRPRSALNIFVAEHFQEAKGVSPQGKLKYLFDEWKKMPTSLKQAYLQLAEDDKVRYKNEITSWEEHMKEIGHEDLVRYRSKRQILTERTKK